MIQVQTRLRVADNTGARTIECIRIMGRSRKTTAGIGDAVSNLSAVADWELSAADTGEQVDGLAVAMARSALGQARTGGHHVLILDTAGRQVIDDDLMGEIRAVQDAVKASERLLVLDAMTGQTALPVAEQFHAAVGLTGCILTKTDADVRGGAALSVAYSTGVPGQRLYWIFKAIMRVTDSSIRSIERLPLAIACLRAASEALRTEGSRTPRIMSLPASIASTTA